MRRRLHVSRVAPGIVALDEGESHHARQVLRLRPGDAVEAFDRGGNVAEAKLIERDGVLCVQIGGLSTRRESSRDLTVLVAVPKGERADWMVEKLGEIGVRRVVPLLSARSVVEPGPGKVERWRRLAVASAKQSRRAGVMEIGQPLELAAALGESGWGRRIVLATEVPGAGSLADVTDAAVAIFVGPEGGWTARELDAFASAGVEPARLTDAILRVETAAVVAAGVLLCAPGNARGRA